jgi:hypothetical protein
MDRIDPRIVRVGIEVEGRLKIYDGLAVVATGTKYANAVQNEVEVRIANMDRATRDYILTETSPLNLRRSPKRLIVEAGRQSYGTSQIIVGDIITSIPSQPPDIWITLRALTSNFQSGVVVSRSQGAVSSVAQIAQQVAGDLGLSLDFRATDKNIANYAFNGGVLKQVSKLNEFGDYAAYVDDRTLVVKNKREPLADAVKVLNVDSGMIGVPEISVHGIRVKYLLDNVSRLGGELRVQSRINPTATGRYCIYKLGFEITSRDTPFYYIAEGYRL